ncbi:MAG: hypothetical protein QW292_11965 [Candidatus Parvarchaeota archaeon]
MMDLAFLDCGITAISKIRIKSDNKRQFGSRIAVLFLSSSSIGYERIRPTILEEDAHVESYDPILEKEVIRRFEFSSFRDA